MVMNEKKINLKKKDGHLNTISGNKTLNFLLHLVRANSLRGRSKHVSVLMGYRIQLRNLLTTSLQEFQV